MSELFDKQTECIKRDFEEKLPKLLQAHEKVCDENVEELEIKITGT